MEKYILQLFKFATFCYKYKQGQDKLYGSDVSDQLKDIYKNREYGLHVLSFG